jgi:GntR family transcriptional regulator
MLIRIDPAGPDIYRQVASSVRRAIADGVLKPGDRLPTARELAASLSINFHTVRRAYGDLVDEGLVDMRPGRGAVVVGNSAGWANLRAMAERFAAEAKQLGLSRVEVNTLIEEYL